MKLQILLDLDPRVVACSSSGATKERTPETPSNGRVVRIMQKDFDSSTFPSSSSCRESVNSDLTFNSDEFLAGSRVSFQESCEEHESNFGSLGECKSLWYSTDEIGQFKKDNAKYAFSLQKRYEKTTDSWLHSLETFYDAMCQSPTEEKVNALLRSANTTDFQTAYLGMDGSVQSIMCERQRRKEVLYSQFEYWQSLGILDTSSQAEMLQRISEGVSKRSRLMAFVVAKVTASATL